jgi:hypothetical protein
MVCLPQPLVHLAGGQVRLFHQPTPREGYNRGLYRGTTNPPGPRGDPLLPGGYRRFPGDPPDDAYGDPEVRCNPPRPLPGLQHRLDGVPIEHPPRAPPVLGLS